MSLAQAAAQLGMCPSTLASWMRPLAPPRRTPAPRGRPPRALTREQRTACLALLYEAGPAVSRHAFCAMVPPDVPRREAERLHERFRFLTRARRGTHLIHALRWHRPGRVWAIDYTEPAGNPVEGAYRYVCSLRDLASGRHLAAWPTPRATAAMTVALLRHAFAAHGAPLVLKSDNGGHFTAEEVTELLRAHRIAHLRSPVFTPRYNGACEAGIGALQTRALHRAAQYDHPERITCDDVEYARRLANATAHPFGPHAPTPDAAWERRTPIAAEERDAFQRTLAEVRAEHEAAWADEFPDQADIDHPLRRLELDRSAIAATLHRLDYLTTRRRRIRQPFPWRRRAEIT